MPSVYLHRPRQQGSHTTQGPCDNHYSRERKAERSEQWVQETGWNNKGRMQRRGLPQGEQSGNMEGQPPHPFIFLSVLFFLFLSSFSFFNLLLVVVMGDVCAYVCACMRACMFVPAWVRTRQQGWGWGVLLPLNEHGDQRTFLEFALSVPAFNVVWDLNSGCQLFVANACYLLSHLKAPPSFFNHSPL